MTEEEPPPLLREGAELFNAGHYFEAHEVLERAWIEECGAVRGLYQGVLQVGVGLHHARRGNRRGALALLDRGMAHLAEFRPQRLGLDVDRLLNDTLRARRRLAAPHGMAEFDWSRPPQVHLMSMTREPGA
jgi:predicted metal-dependent hydrolase